MANFKVSPEAVKILLDRRDVQSSPGPDCIHPVLLKPFSSIISHPLTVIFQLSLDSGCLPHDWKRGIVKPLSKGGDPSDPANYRTVILTSTVGKLLEQMVKEKLGQFLEEIGQTPYAQHSSTKSLSSISNLLTTREHWCTLLDSRIPVDVIFIDFSKAFDRVPHQRLLEKLRASVVSEDLLEWISDFLIARSSQVDVNGSKSFPSTPTSSVPQGSVLCPLLFKYYVADLPDSQKSGCLLFTDDINVWAFATELGDSLKLQPGYG